MRLSRRETESENPGVEGSGTLREAGSGEGEKLENCAIFCNIESTDRRAVTGRKRYGKWEVQASS